MKIAPSSIAILLVAVVAAPMPHAATAQLRGGGGGGKGGTGDRTASASPGQVQDVPGDDVALENVEDVPGVEAEATIAGSRAPSTDVEWEDVEQLRDVNGERQLDVRRVTDRKPYFVQGMNGCSGTLVAPDVVLTSASCKDGFIGAPNTVIVGSNRLDELTEGSERLNIFTDTAVTHPEWDPQTFHANLMLFKIQTSTTNAPITLSNGVRLYEDDRVMATSDNIFTTLGFGRDTPTGGTAGQDLLSVELRPVRTTGTDCDDWIARAHRSADGVSCGYTWTAEPSRSDLCQASAGAPVVDYFGRLLGVTSWDDGCATNAWAHSAVATSMAYSSMVHFGPWIKATICSLSDSRAYCPPPRGGWTDGALCGLGSTCNKCMNPATYWYSKAMTACGTEPCWPRRTICAAGSTCNQCCSGYSWKLEDFFTSCD